MKMSELAKLMKGMGGVTVKGNTVMAGWNLDLSGLKTLPEGCEIEAAGYLDLRKLRELPKGCTLKVGGWLYLNSLKTLPEGCTLLVGRCLYLGGLKTLPEGCTLLAGIVVRAQHIDQTWKGMRLLSVDGKVEVVDQWKQVGDVEVAKAKTFKGDSTGKKWEYFVARKGNVLAHGKSVRDAVEDVQFKIAVRDPEGIVKEIRETGKVTLMQYRAITGACREGVRRWLEEHGLSRDTEEMPLVDVLSLLREDDYGASRFTGLLG